MTFNEVKKACNEFNRAAQKFYKTMKDSGIPINAEIACGVDVEDYFDISGYVAAIAKLDLLTDEIDITFSIN